MLRGKTAIVTGSTSGIGLAIARLLASRGANIVLNGFGKPQEIEGIRRDLETSHAIEADYCPADMLVPKQIEHMVRATQERFGTVDILVNNAGVQHVSPIESFPVDQWDRIIAINLSSAFHAIRASLPAMRSRGWAES